MAFFEQRFPECISINAKGGPVFSTTVAASAGRRFANRNWAYPKHRYNVGHVARDDADFALLRDFFLVVAGRADGFRYKDYGDYKVTQAQGRLDLISGNNYQMVRVYTVGARSFVRRITKPVSASTKVFRTRASVVTDITTTDGGARDATKGAVTITNHQAGDTYAWSGEFDVPVAFASDEAAFTLLGGPTMLTEWPDITLEEIPA